MMKVSGGRVQVLDQTCGGPGWPALRLITMTHKGEGREGVVLLAVCNAVAAWEFCLCDNNEEK